SGEERRLAPTLRAVLAYALVAGLALGLVALQPARATVVGVGGHRRADAVAHRLPHRTDARAGDADVAAGARRATGAAVVVVGLGGDAGVAAAHRAGHALGLARRQAAGEEREQGEEERGQDRSKGRRHGVLSMEMDGGVEGAVRGRSSRTVKVAR